MPVIVQRPRAKSDLIDIWDYIADDSETRADDFVDRVHQKFLVLADQPHVGRPRDELMAGLRSFPVGRYLIFYRPLPEGIEVVRVLHGARDINVAFFTDHV